MYSKKLSCSIILATVAALTLKHRFPPYKYCLLGSTILRMTSSSIEAKDLNYINSFAAKAIDQDLMASPGFSLDQLMELAGLSVAAAIYKWKSPTLNKDVLIICGPGNNGGDGLVAARHLVHFGYNPAILYPKHGKGQLFINLLKQCSDLNIPIFSELPSSLQHYGLIVDAIFGFSFEGPIRQPFLGIVEDLVSQQNEVPILSVDVPSGWHVDQGDVSKTGFNPSAVVSLTAPKLCMKSYAGVHFLGGRFIPPEVASRFDLVIPQYKGSDQVVLLSKPEAAAVEEVVANSEPLVAILCTAESVEAAKKIASSLVSSKLVACVNLLPGAVSIYEWEGKLEEAQEVVMIMKTRKSLVAEVTAAVKRLHSYSVPEVIALDLVGGNSAYLQWVVGNTLASSSVPPQSPVTNIPLPKCDGSQISGGSSSHCES